MDQPHLHSLPFPLSSLVPTFLHMDARETEYPTYEQSHMAFVFPSLAYFTTKLPKGSSMPLKMTGFLPLGSCKIFHTECLSLSGSIHPLIENLLAIMNGDAFNRECR